MNIWKRWLPVVVIAASILASGCGGKATVEDAGTGVAETAEAAADAAGSQTQGEDRQGEDKQKADKQGGDVRNGGTGTRDNGHTGDVQGTYEVKDGVYPVEVDSSSNMFRITSCELTVKDGVMGAVMTMGGTGYLKLYMGTGEEALKADEKDYIPYIETESGVHTFEIPVKGLDTEIQCSAFSRNKEKWYDRILVFRGDSLPADAFADGAVTTAESLNLADGMYTAEVALEGGSGRTTVESPAVLRVEQGNVFATIIWSSSNYDYMKVGGEKFEMADTEGNSTFEIPVTGFDWRMPVIADTIAMSEPHEIDYILIFDSATLKKAD